MKTNTIKTAALGITAALLLSVSGAALAADVLKGMIVSKDGSTLTVRSGDTNTVVLLTETTKIQSGTGVLGVRQDTRAPSDLIRGLAIEVKSAEPAGAGGTITATEISFKNSDLKTAQQISAGIASTESQVAENAERIDNIGEMKAVDRTNVLFESGSATISAAGKQQLQDIAAKAKGVTGYRLAVVGRADTTGNAAANQKLSERRAAAVTDYLVKSAGILPVRIMASSAVGSSVVAQDPNPPKTQAEARRVTVTILVSKSAKM